MKHNLLSSLLVVFFGSHCSLCLAEEYTLGPDSQRQEGVPQGTVTKHAWNESKVFPGTRRDYWVYVPAQYDKEQPACVMVFQDGAAYVNEKGQFRAPVVFDNLIHKKEMPVTIGIFINPGVIPAEKPGGMPRRNRSFEYDSLSDLYARFLLEEILPEVGKSYNLTDDPECRAICGISSGGICAWTAAWERPDAFRKVLSHVGSFTNIRGGHVYPALIRKTEKKPIRVFLQDGENDLDNMFGNWPLSNRQMAAALEYSGYDVRFEMGTEGHNGKHGGAILPDSLRWLWRIADCRFQIADLKKEGVCHGTKLVAEVVRLPTKNPSIRTTAVLQHAPRLRPAPLHRKSEICNLKSEIDTGESPCLE